MRELNVSLPNLHDGALDFALRAALPAKTLGLSTYGPQRPISIWLVDATTADDDSTAQSVVAAHDPVFLVTDKTSIATDGIDAATVGVFAPRLDAAPVTLLVNGSVVPVNLIAGAGSVQITSLDAQTITVQLQNPANRSTDQLSITAR